MSNPAASMGATPDGAPTDVASARAPTNVRAQSQLPNTTAKRRAAEITRQQEALDTTGSLARARQWAAASAQRKTRAAVVAKKDSLGEGVAFLWDAKNEKLETKSAFSGGIPEFVFWFSYVLTTMY